LSSRTSQALGPLDWADDGEGRHAALNVLDDVIKKGRLPPKVLIVHQFRLDMLPDKRNIQASPSMALTPQPSVVVYQ
jgi:hypothetical protein